MRFAARRSNPLSSIEICAAVTTIFPPLSASHEACGSLRLEAHGFAVAFGRHLHMGRQLPEFRVFLLASPSAMAHTSRVTAAAMSSDAAEGANFAISHCVIDSSSFPSSPKQSKLARFRATDVTQAALR